MGIYVVCFYFINNFSRTSAVSSTNFRSILIFASCVVGTCNIQYSFYLFISGKVLDTPV